jgi:hypothetical protein
MRASRTVAALSILGANAAAWLLVAACTYGWDAYDPRLGAQQDASTDTAASDASDASDASASDASDASMEADALPSHVTDGLLLLYDFEENGGSIVGDRSGVSPPLDLTINNGNAVAWIPGGLSIVAPTLVSSGDAAATKVIDGCMATNEITLEVWFRPAILSQGGPARLITNSIDTLHRNFQLGQETASFYQARLRTTACLDAGVDAACGDNGDPFLETPHDAGDVTTLGLTHLLFTQDPTGDRRLYVNAVERAAGVSGGDFSSWDTTLGLALANEFTLNRVWLGDLHRVAIYNRALAATEVAQNYAAGP